MKKFLALFLIFTMLLPAAAYGYYTEDTRYATTSVNVRSGPGTKYSIVGGLNRGDIVKSGRAKAANGSASLTTGSKAMYTANIFLIPTLTRCRFTRY